MIQVIYILQNNSNSIGKFSPSDKIEKILCPGESVVLDTEPLDYSDNLTMSIQQKAINESKILHLLPKKYSN